MPKAPSCSEYLAGGCVLTGFAAGVGYGIAWFGFGFEGWTGWHHAGLAGGCAVAGLAVSIGALNAAHRQAVRKFSEGKLGPRFPEPEPPPAG